MTSDAWDVVVVPFPFTDRPGIKRRPALVLSSKTFNSHGHSVMAMITTKGVPAWPGDHALLDSRAAGLRTPCLVRLKLFTLDNRLLLRRMGRLSNRDRSSLAASLDRYLAW